LAKCEKNTEEAGATPTSCLLFPQKLNVSAMNGVLGTEETGAIPISCLPSPFYSTTPKKKKEKKKKKKIKK
jgi:hypothetical protein